MKTIFILALLIFFTMSANISIASEEDDFIKIIDSHANFNEIYRLNTMNNLIGSGPGGNMETADGPYFTVYLLFRGWQNTMCPQGENPSISRCFVDEGVDLNKTLLYSAGVKDVDEDTSTFFSIREKQIVFDNLSGMTTLSLRIRVEWIRVVCDSGGSDDDEDSTATEISFSGCPKVGNKKAQQFTLLRFSSSSSGGSSESSNGNGNGDGDDEGGGGSSCSTTNGTWEGWLSQTIPAPKHIEYNKTHTIALTNYSWGLTANTSLTKEKLGFLLIGHAPICSVEISRNPFEDRDCSKNETISAEISKILPYFRIALDENRQLYYGELLNPSMPPYTDYKNIVIVYDNSSEQVKQILLPEGGMTDKAYVITPFGRKPVDLNVTAKIEESNSSQIIILWLIIIVLFVAMKLMLKGG